MRKLIVSTYATADGKVNDLQEWVTPWNAPEIAAYHADLLANSDALLLGRTTYQVFAMIWPPRAGQEPYADKMNAMVKHVASTTLAASELGWDNAHLIDGDVAEAVAKLKAQDGHDIVVYGGPALIDALLEHDLVDEYRIMLHPVLLGKGRGLVRDGAPRVNLELLGTAVIPPGVAVLTYRPVS
jgi:dihydrofolate reductase